MLDFEIQFEYFFEICYFSIVSQTFFVFVLFWHHIILSTISRKEINKSI